VDHETQQALLELRHHVGSLRSLVTKHEEQTLSLEQQMFKAWKVLEFLIENLAAAGIIKVAEVIDVEYKEIQRE
jgi:hypothetical protein